MVINKEWSWSKDGDVKHGYMDFHADSTCELKDLFGKVHTDFEDMTDYCSWRVSLDPLGVRMYWDLPQPGSLLQEEDGEWITNGRMTLDEIEVDCHVGCQKCNYFGQCVGGCKDTHREFNREGEIHECKDPHPQEYLFVDGGNWMWSSDGVYHNGYVHFTEDHGCKLVNLTKDEHPKYRDLEDYCTWDAIKVEDGWQNIRIYLDLDKPVFIFKQQGKDDKEGAWVTDALITKHSLEVYCPPGCKGCNS